MWILYSGSTLRLERGSILFSDSTFSDTRAQHASMRSGPQRMDSDSSYYSSYSYSPVRDSRKKRRVDHPASSTTRPIKDGDENTEETMDLNNPESEKKTKAFLATKKAEDEDVGYSQLTETPKIVYEPSTKNTTTGTRTT